MSGQHSDEETLPILDSWTTRKLQQTHYNEGYREGLADGKEVTLQDGFDKGYFQCFEAIFKLASLRGMLGTLALQTSTSQESEIYMKAAKHIEEQETSFLDKQSTSCASHFHE